MPPLSGLRSYPLPVNPMSIVESGYKAYDEAQSEEARGLAIAKQRLDLKEAQQAAAELARAPQSLTLGAPAVPAGLTAMPQMGEDEESRAFLPRTKGVPAASETLTEFPRHESPLQFETRRRQEQSRVDAKQADAEALDRWEAGDYKVGYQNARARAYGHWMDAMPEHRSALMEKRNDALNKGVEFMKQGVTRSEVAPKLLGYFKDLETDPLNRVPYWKAMELIATSDDPEIQRQGHEWLQNDLKAYKARRIMTEQGLAIGKVEEMILRKQVERGDKKVFLDDAEYRKIALEVIQALPNEVAVYNEAMLIAKGAVPGMFMRLFHPELDKQTLIDLYQKTVKQVAAEQPNSTAAEILAAAEERFAMLRGGGTPAAQKSKQDLQAAQAERARAGADALERKAMQEASVGGLLNMGRVTPGTVKGITSAIKDIDATMAAIRNDATKSQQEKDQEVMTWEQSKTRLHGLLDRISQAQLARPSGAAAPAVSESRPAAATAPGQPSQATADWIRRAKKLYDDDRTPGKGSWNDEAVQLKYGRLAKRQQTP